MFAERLSRAWKERRGAIAVDSAMRFTKEGLVLGAGTLLVEADPEGREVSIDPGEPRLRALLMAAHLRSPTAESLSHLRKAAERWSEGQEALAAMHLALSRVDRLERPESDAHRLFLADELLRAGFEVNTILKAVEAGDPALNRLQKFNSDQPRVPAGSGRTSGEWTSTNSSSFIGSSSGESPASADFQSGADTTENAPTENVPQSSAYPPQPEVNPNSVTEVAQRPFESVHACTLARADCINAAFEASGGAANDNSRFVDMKNCNDAGYWCDQLSWIVEDIPGIDRASVIFPHRGVVLINKGRLDRYFRPLSGGRPPVLKSKARRSLPCRECLQAGC